MPSAGIRGFVVLVGTLVLTLCVGAQPSRPAKPHPNRVPPPATRAGQWQVVLPVPPDDYASLRYDIVPEDSLPPDYRYSEHAGAVWWLTVMQWACGLVVGALLVVIFRAWRRARRQRRSSRLRGGGRQNRERAPG